MKSVMLSLMLVFFVDDIFGQSSETIVNTAVEQQIESMAETTDETENDDDSYLQELQQLLKDPIDLNTATAEELGVLKMLNPLQIQSLMLYRNQLGKLISLYEMQAIPGWNIDVISKVKMYVTVAANISLKQTIIGRMKNGSRSLLLRAGQVLEKNDQYDPLKSSASTLFHGSPQKILLRFRYDYKGLLSYGFTGEKDAGESFFKGAQRYGFDHNGAYFFVKNVGHVKALALGDFTVNMGQGLIQWMSMAFKKGSDLLAMKRQGPVLKAYTGAGEYNFHRGAGITIAKNKLEATLFASLRRLDANWQGDDSSGFVSSIQTSGLHRTKGEIEDKGVQQQITTGGNLKYSTGNFSVALNGIYYQFKHNIEKRQDPYNLFAFKGKSWANYSVDYSYTFHNIHFFGEMAVAKNGALAVANGLLAGVSANTDIGIFYRKFDRAYQSFFSNAFSESTMPSNESGFFTGISTRLNGSWRLDAYADIFRFPWLRYRVHRPDQGADFLCQLTWKPNKVLEIYSRFHAESKSINNTTGESPVILVAPRNKQQWRIHCSYKLSESVSIRLRSETVWYDKGGDLASQGFLLYGDIFWKKMGSVVSGNCRAAYFETADYNSRLYAFENDVLYSYAVPMLYGRGVRLYINTRWKLSKRLILWEKLAMTTLFPPFTSSGALKPAQTELKMQFCYNF